MRIAILVFSPSGNTRSVAEGLRDEFDLRMHDCRLVDLTADEIRFKGGTWESSLAEKVGPHDILVIGGPVYANHLHFNVLDLIAALPKPDSFWGMIAIPFVTYGGVSSGIALTEAGSALHRSGRVVAAGLKVSASHRMTRAFMETEFNAGISEVPMRMAVATLVNRIAGLAYANTVHDVRNSFWYNGLKTWIKATLVFREKKWHRCRYPSVLIDGSRCSGCGTCMRACPVLRLRKNAEGKAETGSADCIHCLNCVTVCPETAVTLSGNLEKGRQFMAHMIECHANRELPATAVYPLVSSGVLSGKGKISTFLFGKMLTALVDAPRDGMSASVALEAAGIRTARRVLEVGCGSGYYTREAGSLLAADAEYVAIDLHPDAVAATVGRIAEADRTRIRVLRENALETSFPDSSFDLILLFGILPSPFLPIPRLMPEMMRLLSPGGRIAVWTLMKGWDSNRLTAYGLKPAGSGKICLYMKTAADGNRHGLNLNPENAKQFPARTE